MASLTYSFARHRPVLTNASNQHGASRSCIRVVGDETPIPLSDGTHQTRCIIIPTRPRTQWKLSDFELCAVLGQGQHGTVMSAVEKKSNFVVCLKKVTANLQVAEHIAREIEIGLEVRHRFCMRTYGYFVEENDIYLITEYVHGGMLYNKLQEVRMFPPEKAAKYVAQLAEASMYLNSKNVMHRDIKPENILLDQNDNIRLGDFGLSIHVQPGERRTTACGTHEYFPIEICNNEDYGMAVDAWCLGIFCYELLVGNTPFNDPTNDNDKVIANIKRGVVVYPPHLVPEAVDFIQKLLVKDQDTRMTVAAAIEHDFLQKFHYSSVL